jgi:hypothetical protein
MCFNFRHLFECNSCRSFSFFFGIYELMRAASSTSRLNRALKQKVKIEFLH